MVTVPDVEGMTFIEAQKFLVGLELGYETIDSAYNSEFPPLTVLKQFPGESTKVKVHRKINLTLNARNPPVILYPNLVGSTFDFAQRQLKQLDLKVGTIQYKPDIAHNVILESKVMGNTVHAGQGIPKGSTVDLIIGSNVDEFPLPDFARMPFDEAEAAILGINLKIKSLNSVIEQSEDSNKVQRQYPLPGAVVRHGDEVELWIYNLKK